MIAKEAGSGGVPVLVLDPSCARWPQADFVTADTDEYIEMVFSNSRCLLIIDEAAEAIGRAQSKDDQNRVKLATRTRHHGHNAIFISQDAVTINSTIRRQCEKLWCFRQSYPSIKTLSQHFANDGIMAATSLKKGECLYADLYGNVSQFNVFTLDKSSKKASDTKSGVAIEPIDRG